MAGLVAVHDERIELHAGEDPREDQRGERGDPPRRLLAKKIQAD